MMALSHFLDNVDATDKDHEDYMTGLGMNYGSRFFCCNSEGHFSSECIHFWDAVADAKHPSHERHFRFKASRALLMNEAESRKKEDTQGTFTTENVKTLPDDAIALSVM